jgi:CRISPR system Cascade subunit CasD
MSRWLKLDVAAPMLAFGGVSIDHVGPTRDFPAASMLTGLFGNALGWHWRDRAAHQNLQDRLVFATALIAEGRVLTDVQNAKLEKTDRGWTSWGLPEGRDGASYDAPHRRRRDYLCDAEVLIVCRLSSGPGPEIEALAAALERPARPLFLGRKPCLPARRLFAGWVEAATAYAALAAALPTSISEAGARAQWPESEGPSGARPSELTDLRNWHSGLHGGSRPVVEGRLAPASTAP